MLGEKAIAILQVKGIVAQYRNFVQYTKSRSYPFVSPFITLITFAMTGSTNVVAAVIGAASTYLMILSAFSYNDAYDIDLDKINGYTDRTRNFSKRQLIILTYLLWTFAFLIIIPTNNWKAVVVVTISIAFAFVYSHPKLNLKEKFPFKTLITALDASTACLMGAAVGNSLFSTYTLFSSAGIFAFLFILGPLGDLQDIKGDAIVGRRTFPTVLGSRNTILIMVVIPVILITTAGITFLKFPISNGNNLHIDLGVLPIFIVCMMTLLFIIFKIKKKTHDAKWIKESRTTMRSLNILFQLSIVVAFMINVKL